jgi:hypothetical protein
VTRLRDPSSCSGNNTLFQSRSGTPPSPDKVTPPSKRLILRCSYLRQMARAVQVIGGKERMLPSRIWLHYRAVRFAIEILTTFGMAVLSSSLMVQTSP